MHQKIQQEVAGSVADTDLQFVVVQSPTQPWNTLLGGLFEFGKDGYVLARGRARRSQVDPRGGGVPVLMELRLTDDHSAPVGQDSGLQRGGTD